VIRNSTGILGKGLDIRANGGYVVAPPSLHPSGLLYEWLAPEQPLADVPPWMLAKLAEAKPAPAAQTLPAQGEVIATGGRNAALTSLAGTMRRRGMTPEAIEAALMKENGARCKPPLPTNEVREIARSVARYPPAALDITPFSVPLDEWPEPEPLATSIPDVMPFDLALMPESFRPLVKDVAERMQVPLDFPAVTAIATLAGVTNRRAEIQPKRNDHTWTVIPNLWGGIVAPPGMLKSPVVSCMTQNARAIEHGWRDAHEAAEQEYKSALEEQELKKAAWKDRFKAAAKKNQDAPARPESDLVRPVLRRLITSDATFESLHLVLSENPAGLFVLRDELTGWLAGLERQGREQERAFFLECWNGDAAFTIDRIGRGSVHVPRACISLFGGIQPARLRDYLADAMKNGPSNDGLMQRFQLIVWPDMPPEWSYVDRKPDTEAQARTAEVYRRITAMDPTKPLRLQFDDEAQALFEQWLTDLEQRIRDDSLPLSMQAHLAKFRSLMPSLALLFTLADGQEKSVPISQARLACEWCEYLESHARRVYASQALPELEAAIALSRRLAKGWKQEEGCFTVRDVYRNAWSLLNTPDEARAALSVLEEYRWVRREKSSDAQNPGRPSENYYRNPRIGEPHAN
jgi:putative DNA primase/helicase